MRLGDILATALALALASHRLHRLHRFAPPEIVIAGQKEQEIGSMAQFGVMACLILGDRAMRLLSIVDR